MSIHTIATQRQGDRTIALVKITDPHNDKISETAWEFHCEECDELCTGLSEAEAKDELDNHECKDTDVDDN